MHLQIISDWVENKIIQESSYKNYVIIAAFVILELLDRLFEQKSVTKDNSKSIFGSIEIEISLNDYLSMAIKMINDVFRDEKTNTKQIRKNVTINNLDKNQLYSNVDMFMIINNSLKMIEKNFFSLLFKIFRYID